jgi:hypothetical protein
MTRATFPSNPKSIIVLLSIYSAEADPRSVGRRKGKNGTVLP